MIRLWEGRIQIVLVNKGVGVRAEGAKEHSGKGAGRMERRQESPTSDGGGAGEACVQSGRDKKGFVSRRGRGDKLEGGEGHLMVQRRSQGI